MIYLDNAATTMHKPQTVIDAVTQAMCSLGNAGRGATSGASMPLVRFTFAVPSSRAFWVARGRTMCALRPTPRRRSTLP